MQYQLFNNTLVCAYIYACVILGSVSIYHIIDDTYNVSSTSLSICECNDYLITLRPQKLFISKYHKNDNSNNFTHTAKYA